MTTSRDDSDDHVTKALRALSDEYEPMPSAVADRLDHALRELPDQTAPDTAPVVPAPISVPWWKRRFALGSAFGTVTAVVVGVSVLLLQPFGAEQNEPLTSSAGSAEDSQTDEREGFGEEGQPEARESGEYTVTFTGTDYSAAELDSATGVTQTGDPDQVSDELAALATDTAARDACLTGLTEVFDAQPASVDFGSYQGTPAMVAVLQTSGGQGSVVATGKHCDDTSHDILGSTSL